MTIPLLAAGHQREAFLQQNYIGLCAAIYQNLSILDFQRAFKELEEGKSEWRVGEQDGEEPNQLRLNATGMLELSKMYAKEFIEGMFNQ